MSAFLVADQALVWWVHRLKKDGRAMRVKYFHNSSGMTPLMVSYQSSQLLWSDSRTSFTNAFAVMLDAIWRES